jgi:CheY-like chemotaxis protein
MASGALKILMVEDDEDDAALARDMLCRSGIPVEVQVVENGLRGLAYLRNEGSFAGVPSPDLILLDLNMPVMDGRELLRRIKEDARLKFIPVVVFTTSEAEREVRDCYGLGANCYVAKPLGLAGLSKAIRHIKDFWLGLAKLPKLL